MSVNLEFSINKKILQVISKTCEDECEEIANQSADKEEAEKRLLKKVYEKIEPIFQSEEFLKVYKKSRTTNKGLSPFESAQVKYRGEAIKGVEEMVSLAWKWRLEVEELGRKTQVTKEKAISTKVIHKSRTKTKEH